MSSLYKPSLCYKFWNWKRRFTGWKSFGSPQPSQEQVCPMIKAAEHRKPCDRDRDLLKLNSLLCCEGCTRETHSRKSEECKYKALYGKIFKQKTGEWFSVSTKEWFSFL